MYIINSKAIKGDFSEKPPFLCIITENKILFFEIMTKIE